MFMMLCKHRGLNPFLREAYLIKYSSGEPASIVTGKDTFTSRAASIPSCAGYNAGIIVRRKEGGRKLIEKHIGACLQSDEELIGGWARIQRRGWKEALLSRTVKKLRR